MYSNKEIAIRELVSNASDACDAFRHWSLTAENHQEGSDELKTVITYDKDNKTLMIADNGIGMSADDVTKNLGTIAHSGTRALREIMNKNEGGDTSELIGQFGVGFYSAFVIAEKVVVRTRKAGLASHEAVMWSSDGMGEYALETIDKKMRGTEITLFMKDEDLEFLDDYRLRSIITKYSDHIMMPIYMQKPVMPSPEAEKEGEENKETVEEKPTYEIVNRARAFWTQGGKISDQEFEDFYSNVLVANDPHKPFSWSLNKVEGSLEYTTLLYLPSKAPFNLWDADARRGLKLYVKRVFIMDHAEKMLPMYLRFVRGVVDSQDLPLNVSRELLQSNRVVEKIKASCTKRILGMLEKMADRDAEKYASFWAEFGAVLKEGVIEDFSNRDRISNLLRFSSSSSQSETDLVSFKDYMSRMQEGQEKIYYLIAEDYESAKNSPLLEVFKSKGIEVLFFTDRVDEWVASHLSNYESKSLESISSGELDLKDLGQDETNEIQEEKEQQEKDFESLLKQLKEMMASKVKDVRLSSRLTESPSCVVTDSQDMSPQMLRMLQAAGQEVPESKPILELNPNHAFVKNLLTMTDDELLKDWIEVLWGQAMMVEGESIKNASSFVSSVNALLSA